MKRDWDTIVRDSIDPTTLEKTTDVNEQKLLELKEMEIGFEDTAVARLAEIQRRELIAAVGTLGKEERDKVWRKLDEVDLLHE